MDVHRNCAFHLGKEGVSKDLLGAVDDALCRENGQDLLWPLPCSSWIFLVKHKALLCHTCSLCCSFSLKGLLEKWRHTKQASSILEVRKPEALVQLL